MSHFASLPTASERTWLLDGLTTLVRQRGYEPFVLHPLLEPTRRFFPEHRGEALYVLDRTTRRLMQYAGLARFEVALDFFSERDEFPGVAGGSTRCSLAAAVFLGLDGHRCHFAINREQSHDAEHLVGVMCHEVAHAWRAHHRLAVPEAEQEEHLTDLTTVYLGFGILSTNNSFRYRSHGEIAAGYGVRTVWGSSSSGYLPPQAFSFLLACQLAVRGASWWERRAVLKHLETDQAAYTKEALRFLRGAIPDLPATLGIPGRNQRGPLRGREEFLGPLPEYELEPASPDDESPAP